jgi:hypothetical protein
VNEPTAEQQRAHLAALLELSDKQALELLHARLLEVALERKGVLLDSNPSAGQVVWMPRSLIERLEQQVMQATRGLTLEVTPENLLPAQAAELTGLEKAAKANLALKALARQELERLDRLEQEQAKQRSALEASAMAAQRAADRRAVWLPIARELREKHPEMANMSLAQLVTRREPVRMAGITTRSIRRGLAEEGLNPRK